MRRANTSQFSRTPGGSPLVAPSAAQAAMSYPWGASVPGTRIPGTTPPHGDGPGGYAG